MDVPWWVWFGAVGAGVCVVLLVFMWIDILATADDRWERDARRAEAAARAWQRSRTAQALRRERERRDQS